MILFIFLSHKSIEQTLNFAPSSLSHAKFVDGLFQDINVLLDDLYSENSNCIPDRLLKKARRFAEHLQKTTERKAILHGDLHPDNIIKDVDEWKVIDPQAVVGDPIYELSAPFKSEMQQERKLRK